MVKSPVIGIIQPRFGQSLYLAVVSWQERQTVHGIEAPGKETVASGTPVSRPLPVCHLFFTACPGPLPETFLCAPNSPRLLFLTTSAHSDFSNSSSKLPRP